MVRSGWSGWWGVAARQWWVGGGLLGVGGGEKWLDSKDELLADLHWKSGSSRAHVVGCLAALGCMWLQRVDQ